MEEKNELKKVLEELYEKTNILKNYPEFSDREIGLVKDMLRYTMDDTHGLAGHNVYHIVIKLLNILNVKSIDTVMVDTHYTE